MKGLVIVLIGIVVLGAGYLFYGRWLANKWGIDAKAKTPAYTHEDGQDYVPSSKFTVFAHQFSSIAGAGAVALAIFNRKCDGPFLVEKVVNYACFGG